MAFKTFTDGIALTAAEMNTYLMKQSLVAATAGTRPSSPSEGMCVYETDTDKLMVYASATTGWQPPWNMPWGMIAQTSTTTQQGGITTLVSLTSLAVGPTLVANRLMKVTAWIPIYGNTADDYFSGYILHGSTNIAIDTICVGSAPSIGQVLKPSGYFTSVAGAIAIGASAARVSGSGAGQTNCASTNPCYLLVEDIGPAAAPA